jgi:hypothetical protein
MRAFYDGDTYVSLPGNFKVIDQLVRALVPTLDSDSLLFLKFTLIVGGAAKIFLFSNRKPKTL